MKTSIIPAQITTVEDKIAGNFTLTQILLFLLPIFISVFIYAVLPVRMHLSIFKLVLMSVVTILCFALALRIKGRIVLHWLVTLSHYNLRPRYYVQSKNDPSLREMTLLPLGATLTESISSTNTLKKENPALSPEQDIRLQHLMSNPQSMVRFRFKKGGVHVDSLQISS